jgi:hypothetical protein
MTKPTLQNIFKGILHKKEEDKCKIWKNRGKNKSY